MRQCTPVLGITHVQYPMHNMTMCVSTYTRQGYRCNYRWPAGVPDVAAASGVCYHLLPPHQADGSCKAMNQILCNAAYHASSLFKSTLKHIRNVNALFGRSGLHLCLGRPCLFLSWLRSVSTMVIKWIVDLCISHNLAPSNCKCECMYTRKYNHGCRSIFVGSIPRLHRQIQYVEPWRGVPHDGVLRCLRGCIELLHVISSKCVIKSNCTA